MNPPTRTLPLLATLALLAPAAARPAAPPRPRTDRHGDPLPPGAVLRLGSARLRQRAPVTCLVFAPDGRGVASADEEGSVSVWAVPGGALLLQLPEGTGKAVAFSPDGKVLAAADSGATLRLLEVATGKLIRKIEALPGAHSAPALAFSPDGRLLACGGPDPVVRLWDPATGREVRKLEGHKLDVSALAFSRDGKTLASGDSAGSGSSDSEDAGPTVIILWDVKTGKERVRFPANPDRVQRIDFAPDGKTLASAGASDVRVWKTDGGKQLHRFHAGPCNGVAFAPAASALVAGGRLGLWDPSAGRKLRDLGEREREVQAVAASPDGKVLASGDRAGRVRLWNALTGKELGVMPGPQFPVVSVAFSPDGNLAACGSADAGAVFVWGLGSGALLRKVDLDCPSPGEQNASALSFSPDGRTLASWSDDGIIHFWQLETGKHRSFGVGERWVMRVAFAPDGKTLAAFYTEDGFRRGVIGIYDTATGKEARRIRPFGDKEVERRHLALTFSPDGKTLALGAVPEARGRPDKRPRHDTIHLFDVATGEERRAFRIAREAPAVLAFSPDGKRLAVASTRDQPVEVWDASTGEEVRKLRGREEAGNWDDLTPLAFSPDGKTLATGARDTVVLWDVATGKEVRRMAGHAGPVRCLSFSPDGRSLLSGGDDATALLWSLLPPHRPGAKELGRLWADLADPDPAVAHTALSGLAAEPGAVAFLKERLPPARALDLKKVPRLVADLGDARPAVRQAVARELKEFGDRARPALFAALRGKLAPPTRRRVELLLEAIELPGPSAEARALRAIQVLERVGTPGAEGLLESQARGAPDRDQTRDAVAALGRLRARRRLARVRVLTDAEIESARRHRAGSREPRSLRPHEGTVTSLVFSADGKLLLSSSLDGAVTLREAETDREIAHLKANKEAVFGAALSPDGRRVASAGAEGRVRLWDVSTGRQLCRVAGHRGGALCVAFSPDGKTLASGGADGMVRLWAVAGGEPVSQLKALAAKVTSVAFAPDGRSLAVAGLNTKSAAFAGGVVFKDPEHVQLWDLRAGKDRKLDVRGAQVAFTPDGFGLVASGRFTLIGRNPGGPAFIGTGEESIYTATRITWWDLRRGRELRRAERKGGCAAVSADGALAASCGGFEEHYGPLLWGTNRIGAGPERGQRVRLWDARACREVLTGPRCEATAVALSPEGRLLAWGDEKGGVTLWDLAPADALARYPRGPGPGDLEALWEELGADPARAYQAAWALEATRPAAWLAKRVKAVPPADGKRIARLVGELGSEEFAVREAAARELGKLGAAAEPALRRAREGEVSPEAARRIAGLLRTSPRKVLTAEEWRQLRAVGVLERIASPGARRVLETLARGEATAARTRAARAALARLRGRAGARR